MNEEIPVEHEKNKPAKNIYSFLLLITIGAVLVITAIIFYPETRMRIENRPTLQSADGLNPDINPVENATQTPQLPLENTNTPDPSPTPIAYTHQSQFGILVLSIREGSDIHLFAYQPFLEESTSGDFTALPLTRLTAGSHQDRAPAINPDGTKIAFSSNRDGQWDIYILDLKTGDTNRFTNTQAYDGNPTWSPDGQWLAYESYNVNNLDIFIQDLENTVGPIPLTNHPAADYAPSWSAQGRKIGFITTRLGTQEVWYADLDSSQQDKAVRINNLPGFSIKHPTWTSDGRYLSWSIITKEGSHSLVTWDSLHPEQEPILIGTGDWPLWAGAGEILYSLVEDPQSTYLTAYPGIKENSRVMLPAVKIPGSVWGISWTEAILIPARLAAIAESDPTPLWKPANDREPEQKELVQINNLETSYPYFHPNAAKTFKSLRNITKDLVGWDFLSAVENAYRPLTGTHDPGVNLNWLYTGRGFTTNDIPRLANWVVVVREDFGTQTYWRLYIKANKQDGSQGMPLSEFPWDFQARYTGSNLYFENGGAIATDIPEGYWIDFTDLARAYGWMRFPGQSYWQFSESASRYQYFAFTQNLSLESALLEVYKPEEIKDIIQGANP